MVSGVHGRRHGLLAFLPAGVGVGRAQAPARSRKAWLAHQRMPEPERKCLAVSGEQPGWGFQTGLRETW